jgi:hypothetical protein
MAVALPGFNTRQAPLKASAFRHTIEEELINVGRGIKSYKDVGITVVTSTGSAQHQHWIQSAKQASALDS